MPAARPARTGPLPGRRPRLGGVAQRGSGGGGRGRPVRPRLASQGVQPCRRRRARQQRRGGEQRASAHRHRQPQAAADQHAAPGQHDRRVLRARAAALSPGPAAHTSLGGAARQARRARRRAAPVRAGRHDRRAPRRAGPDPLRSRGTAGRPGPGRYRVGAYPTLWRGPGRAPPGAGTPSSCRAGPSGSARGRVGAYPTLWRGPGRAPPGAGTRSSCRAGPSG